MAPKAMESDVKQENGLQTDCRGLEETKAPKTLTGVYAHGPSLSLKQRYAMPILPVLKYCSSLVVDVPENSRPGPRTEWRFARVRLSRSSATGNGPRRYIVLWSCVRITISE
jgi:hypothetical protein